MNKQVIYKIQSYISSDDSRPLIIDVSNISERDDFHQQFYSLHKKSVFELTEKGSELPTIEKLYNFMEYCNEKCMIINDLGTFLKLEGEQKVRQVLHTLLGKAYSTKFLILTFQCDHLLDDKDPRNKEKIILTGESKSIPATLVFMKREFEHYEKCEKGLTNALKKIERSESKIYVTTDYKQSDFNDSLLKVETCDSPYDLLVLKDASTKKINKNYGAFSDWETLLLKLENDSLEETLNEYVNTRDYLKNIEEWMDKTDFEKWVIFLYGKFKNIKTENYAVDYSINKSLKYTDVLKNIYDSIADLSYQEEGYWEKYNQRKNVLRKINNDDEIYEYCNYIKSVKGGNAIYYLTDNTDIEKKLTIELIDNYYSEYPKQKLLSILARTYKDLFNYLSDYNFEDEFLTKYFNEYKYLKVINHLTDDFKLMVDSEARERKYKRILMYRSEKLEELTYDDSIVYFIDALGVEFVSYIIKKCNELDLVAKVHICHANLPTLTFKNTEFRDFFAKKGIVIKDEKELDELIHDGKNDYDFDRYKLPIHIIEEFNIIDKNLKDIRRNLKDQKFAKAVVVSDHGATRLAILNTDSVKIDVESVGEHGGRVCKAIKNVEIIPNAISEEGYWILGDYNSFKGGRKGKVEMHGGSTLEKVVVPIIEILNKFDDVPIKVLTQIIKVGYKKPGILKFYLNKKLLNVIVKLNGNTYHTTSEDGFTFTVDIGDIKKSGTYQFEVWANGQLITDEGTFKIEKMMATTNDLF